MLEDRVKSAYEVATGKKKVEQGEQDGGPVKKRIPQEGDSCPICCTFPRWLFSGGGEDQATADAFWPLSRARRRGL
jgi:hypothetical protein